MGLDFQIAKAKGIRKKASKCKMMLILGLADIVLEILAHLIGKEMEKDK